MSIKPTGSSPPPPPVTTSKTTTDSPASAASADTAAAASSATASSSAASSLAASSTGNTAARIVAIWREVINTKLDALLGQSQLSEGEAVAAKVQSILEASGATPKVTLDIGGKLLEVVTGMALKPGDWVKVTLTEAQQLLLEPSRPPGTSAQNAAGLATTLNTAAGLADLKASDPLNALANRLLQPAAGVVPQLSAQGLTQLLDALAKVMPFQGQLAQVLGKLVQAGVTAGTAAGMGAGNPAQTPDPTQALGSKLASPVLPQPAREALQQLQQALPKLAEVTTAEGLKQALKQSGAFSEQQLTRVDQALGKAQAAVGRPDLAGRNLPPLLPNLPADASLRDLKSLLLQVFVSLSRAATGSSSSEEPVSPLWQPPSSSVPNPLLFPNAAFLLPGTISQDKREQLSVGDLLKLVAQALSRIQTTQLNTVQQRQGGPDTAPVNTWLLELPVLAPNQQINLFQMRIEEEPPSKEQKKQERKQESVWRINLSFNLEPLGPMYSLVRIQRGLVSSTFWAEKDSTKHLLDRELPQLRKALVKLGLDVESLDCLQGQPSFTSHTKLETRLIDVRT